MNTIPILTLRAHQALAGGQNFTDKIEHPRSAKRNRDNSKLKNLISCSMPRSETSKDKYI